VASVLSERELKRILVEFNDTDVDYGRQMVLTELFADQVRRSHGAVALEFRDIILTYRDLDRRANQLGNFLRDQGVGPDVPVGVFMERSIEMVVALYGILKAGGAYVPLDPEYPADRLAFMLEDAQVERLLTQAHLREEQPPFHGAVLRLDADWAAVADHSSAPPDVQIDPDHLAYIIFTSGTTGRPKGVMNTHRGICNRLLWMQDTFRLNSTDVVLQKTPFSFDVSVWEFFWPLLAGAKLVIAKPGGHKDSTYLVDAIVQHGVTTIHFVPSMLGIFLENDRASECASLRRVICSGEALPLAMQDQFFSRLKADLYNLYGPTEAAVDVSYWQCDPESELGFVPIGRPVANTHLYILDEAMQPAPIGGVGELYIGGVQVARGYVNRPELTAQRFIPDPFSKEPGARLYRTGDLASFLPTGDVRFLGRVDHQVKVMGNRIELGEIEAVLDQYKDVRRSVVVAREEGESKRLIAYATSDSDTQPTVPELQAHLGRKLPSYMIPSAFIFLESMPLSPNGKIDRRALPDPGVERPALSQGYAPPGDALESYLAGMWQDILGLDRVGIHDRFFELGGTSLQAARFINRLQKELGENIYIVSIFEAPTVSAYASFLRRDYARSLEGIPGFVRTTDGHGLPARREAELEGQIDARALQRMREVIVPLRPPETGPRSTPNPQAIFILSPPRSGTTLLRVMLAGHPRLFAASELQLLGFNTLAERREAYSGKFSLWLEGALRAIMEIRGCDAREASELMQQYEEDGLSTKQLYALIQGWIGHRVLVDKSPSYVLDIATMRRAEQDFQDPLYIHLVRHPYSMVRSFESYHMDQVLYLLPHDFSPRQLGELVWIISHRNVVQFLRDVPEERQFHMRFEDLVRNPTQVMSNMCEALSLEIHSSMLNPYGQMGAKMVDGIYPESKPMGDTKFLRHMRIRPEIADKWRGVLSDDFLSDIAWDLAAEFGYPRPHSGELTGLESVVTAGATSRASRRREYQIQRRRRRQELRDEDEASQV
jgi:amino acid adenylation domain-containing protein